MQTIFRILLLAASAALTSSSALAVVAWDESSNGDLSGARLSPTVLTFVTGTNTLLATTGTGGDLDYFTFTLPTGFSLTALTLVSYAGTDGTAFLGIQSGATFTEPTSGTVTANLLGYTHIGTAQGNVGTDILDNLGLGAGSAGFTPPLLAGSYSFWMQQASATTTTVQLDFQVIPEPAVNGIFMGLTALAASGVVCLRRKKTATPSPESGPDGR